MIFLRHFGLRRNGTVLLSDVDLTIPTGYRVGIIGRNGTGKSSLFASLLGQLDADSGELELSKGTRIASVAQETPALAIPAVEFVLTGHCAVWQLLQQEAAARSRQDWESVALSHQALEEIDGYSARAQASKLLDGLGFSSDVQDRPVHTFSGGWRMRLNLAHALMQPSDLLLLDEPTNHLDIDAVIWLEQWLQSYQGTVLVISHDRRFLDAIATHILHIYAQNARLYTGKYSDFLRQRDAQRLEQQRAHEKNTAERAHMQEMVARFGAKASKAKQAQSRIKQLKKMPVTSAVPVEQTFTIRWLPPQKQPDTLITLRNCTVGYATERSVLTGVNISIYAKHRLGLLGPNGAGKSTVIKTLVGENIILDGQRIAHAHLRIGYFTQHSLESLTEGTSALAHLQGISDKPTQALRDYLGHWGFAGEAAFALVDTFSGGERARLALALIAWQQPNLLVLDEPTNHLDLEMREALARSLKHFEGAIVLVSHDRYLLQTICTQFLSIRDGRVRDYDGDLDGYYAWSKGQDAYKTGQSRTLANPTIVAKPAVAMQHNKAAKARAAQIASAERRVAELEKQISALDAAILEATQQNDYHTLAEQSRLRQTLADALTEAETLWLNLLDAV